MSIGSQNGAAVIFPGERLHPDALPRLDDAPLEILFNEQRYLREIFNEEGDYAKIELSSASTGGEASAVWVPGARSERVF